MLHVHCDKQPKHLNSLHNQLIKYSKWPLTLKITYPITFSLAQINSLDQKTMSTYVTHDSTSICWIFIAELNMAYIANYKFKMAAWITEITKSWMLDKLISKVGTHCYWKLMVCLIHEPRSVSYMANSLHLLHNQPIKYSKWLLILKITYPITLSLPEIDSLGQKTYVYMFNIYCRIEYDLYRSL